MIKVEAIPILRDNYVWAIHDGRDAVFVDPGEAAPILAWLDDRHMRMAAILVTHHHADHVGGIAELLARRSVPVHGRARGAVPALSVNDGESLHFAAPKLTLQILETPGHTLDHVCYLGHGHLFCGDTLFSCGCGRLFEGTPAQMYASLTRLAALPDDTQVCCAHEYTLANLAFALEADPDNTTLRERHVEALAQRRRGLPTLPVNLARELATNPFLRCDLPELTVSIAQHTEKPVSPGVAAFAALRAWKDAY
jgi:hydroxyacylglutathione hydrolase